MDKIKNVDQVPVLYQCRSKVGFDDGRWKPCSKLFFDKVSAEPDALGGYDEVRALYAAPSLPPFATQIIEKLRRFKECAEDGQGADIGNHWFDILTRLGLLNRVQRSPAWWEITQQGEDALSCYQAAQRVEQQRVSALVESLKSLLETIRYAPNGVATIKAIQDADLALDNYQSHGGDA